MAPTLSILVVNWNTRALTLDCLRSLREAAIALPHDVWLVDNASVDGTADAVAAEFPELRLIRNAENVGFARANNQALAESTGRYALLLNSDTLVAPGQLEKLVAFLDAHPKAGIVGPKLLNADGSFQLSATPFIRPADVYFEFARFPRALQPRAQKVPRRLYPFEPWRAMSVDYVIGAALLIRREVVEAIGPMDAGFSMYGEEQDWCWRAKEAGWEVWFDPEAEITHLGGASTARVPYEMLANRFASSFQLLAKHEGAGAAALTRALVAGGALQNLALAAARRLSGRDDAEAFRHERRGAATVLKTALTGRAPKRTT
jgi:GT2 family glycosyltransferase